MSTMMHLPLAPFYAASISIGADGELLVASSRERVLVWGIVFCVSAAAALILWLLRVRRPWTLAAALATLAIPAFVMPSVRGERIEVRRDRITLESGAWYAPSRSTIDLSDLREIGQDEAQFRFAGLIIEPNAIWQLVRGNGSRERIELNGFFTAHRMVIAQYLRDRGRIVEPLAEAARPDL